ncbi:MAG: ATP-binding cassette domain-containing protein [Planctomycetes bacterium]|nr:ATP-binding cassette domain-containing protein [Planctomycetota bacterium]MCB9884825.1 ATP-binding cassette domain-containing protein [Planctomycetota bacterium]
MIEVEGLEKWYGFAQALKGISFSVQKGEVVGFLGPNGAGKSTTMKILTGYLLPTGGSASVAGFDVVADSLQVRRRIGYLPESTPLYTDMRVDDYLAFCADIRGVPRLKRNKAIGRAVELCGLSKVLGKNIVELSKGYKQRVGLAQAIVHEPPVLILDEPTSGLDPNQIVEVRKLIERLGEEHTVVLSTHYLQEVEKSCTRAIIVSQGEIVADGTQEELVATLPRGPLRARVRGPEENVLRQCNELLHGVPVGVIERGDGWIDYRIDVPEGNAPVVEAFARLVVKNGWDLLELVRERASLEDVFRNLTLDASKEAQSA